MPPDLAVSDDLKQPIPTVIDRSSGLGSALTESIAKEVPGAMASDAADRNLLRDQAGQTIGDIGKTQEQRHNLTAPLPPPPTMAPQVPQPRSMSEQWGGAAMVLAMLGSAFTRRPLINALNAGAEVVKAGREGDLEKYKLNLDNWKQQTEYGYKLYEYQRDAYKDALASIETDQKDSLAKLRVLSAALKDDKMSQLAQAGNIAGILSLEQGRQTTMQHTQQLTQKAQTEAQVTGDLMEAGRNLRTAQQSGDPAAVAEAQQRYDTALQAARDHHAGHAGTTGNEPHFGSMDDQMARWRGEFRAANGRDPTADEIKDRASELKKAETAKGEFGASKEIAILDKDGNAVDRRAARESTTGPGWVDSATGKPIEVPPGGRIDVGSSAASAMGTRDLVYTQRVLNAARTAVSDLVNVSKMGAGATSGVLRGVGSGAAGGMLDATKRTLGNVISKEQTQLYNAANAGVQRAFAQIESAGLAPGYHFSEQFNALTLLEGDTHLTKIYKLAAGRQIVENGMEVILANPRMAPEQKKLAQSYVAQVQKAIPWTTDDVITLSHSSSTTTLRQLGVKDTGGKEAAAAVPKDLPDPKGVAEGSIAKDKDGKPVAVIRNGQWAAP